MPQFQAPIRDYQFLLSEWLAVGKQEDIPGFSELNDDLISSLLSAGASLCEEVLFPLNQKGDKDGCVFASGNVILPGGFVDAYRQYTEAGWPSFTCDPAYGGQGLPECLNIAFIEMVCSSNLSFGIIPGLTHGAYNALHMHASEALKRQFLPHMVQGKWTGVMCLTEPQCGTDLGLIKTTATPDTEGSYRLNGTKIFISAGEHDAVENIIHLVLAKLPDAPPGVKGISLFVAPKIMVNADGSLGEKNGILCSGIEEKMGIHGVPACVMNYDNAKAYLVGEPHKGLKAMFTMMNEARLYVGIQGLGLAEVSYQNAAVYAQERLQGRGLKGAVYPNKPADPLIVHPDVRRMLLTMRSFCEGARALAVYTAMQVDVSKRHPDEHVRQEADDFIQLITPIIKAYYTDMGFHATNLGMQVLGGYGYIREYGMEQYARDARIAMIYEGANGIQALDLVGRKLPKATGRYLRSFFHPATAFLAKHRNNPAMEPFNKPLYKAVSSLQQASMWVAVNGVGDPREAAAVSSDYLKLFAIVAIGYIWAQIAEKCLQRKEDLAGRDPSTLDFYNQKLIVARFYMQKILYEHYSLLAKIAEGGKTLMAMEDSSF